jgi:hypothetical protein
VEGSLWGVLVTDIWELGCCVFELPPVKAFIMVDIDGCELGWLSLLIVIWLFGPLVVVLVIVTWFEGGVLIIDEVPGMVLVIVVTCELGGENIDGEPGIVRVIVVTWFDGWVRIIDGEPGMVCVIVVTWEFGRWDGYIVELPGIVRVIVVTWGFDGWVR